MLSDCLFFLGLGACFYFELNKILIGEIVDIYRYIYIYLYLYNIEKFDLNSSYISKI